MSRWKAILGLLLLAGAMAASGCKSKDESQAAGPGASRVPVQQAPTGRPPLSMK